MLCHWSVFMISRSHGSHIYIYIYFFFQENKLTQLESSVETEEKKWIERLQSKDLELEQVSNCRIQLLNIPS